MNLVPRKVRVALSRWLRSLRPQERPAARSFLKFVVAHAAGFPGYAAIYFAIGLSELGWALLGFGIGVAASPLSSLITGRLSTSTHIVCGITTLSVSLVTYSTGGIESPALYWLTIMPAAAMFFNWSSWCRHLGDSFVGWRVLSTHHDQARPASRAAHDSRSARVRAFYECRWACWCCYPVGHSSKPGQRTSDHETATAEP